MVEPTREDRERALVAGFQGRTGKTVARLIAEERERTLERAAREADNPRNLDLLGGSSSDGSAYGTALRIRRAIRALSSAAPGEA